MHAARIRSYHARPRSDEAVGYTIAACGLSFQWQYGFGLPFPLNVVFWPLDVIEWYIRWTITSDAPIA